MTELGVTILAGPDADEAFGHLTERNVEAMLAENAKAFAALRDLINRMRGFK